jgi:5-hydroxyisourate hydrolase-like protein (transthyretin family)
MAGETVVVTDTNGGPIATVTTDADGRFATDAVRFPKATTLVARWSGGTGRPHAVTYQPVTVPPTDTQLSISAPAQVGPTDSVPLSVHLRSAAGDDVDGMTVDLYRRCDGTGSWETVASVITGSDGTATHSDPAAPCLEVEYLARHEFTQITHTSAVVTSVTVTWRSSALELTTPDDVMAGDTVTVRARLLIDGQPAAGRTVTLRAGDDEARNLVTDDDGLVAAEVTFPQGGYQRVRWDFGGDDRVLPTWADTYVSVPRRGTTLSAEPAATSSTVTEPFTISGTLTDERGQPVPDAELWLSHGYGYTVTAHTGSDGTYTAQVQPARWDPAYPVHISYQGDEAREATGAETVVDVVPLPSSLQLAADAPRVAAGDEVTLSGTLTTALGEDLTGQVVRPARVDPDGTITALPGAHLDADGDFSFTDTPPSEGDTRYVVTRDRDDWYRTVQAETSVAVVTRTPVQLTLKTDRNRYGAGDTATLTLDADVPTDGEVLLTAEDADGTARTVYRGSLPADGLTRQVLVSHTTTFVAELSQTVDHEAAAVRAAREVRLGTTTTVPNAWGAQGGSWLVSPWAEPRILTAVTPRRADVCLRYQVQRRVEGVWRTRETSGCRSTDEQGKATYRMSSKPLGSRWRVRPNFTGDQLNAATTGAWVEFRVRRPS